MSNKKKTEIDAARKAMEVPAPTSPNALVELARAWNPGYAADVAAWAEKNQLDQPYFLADLVYTISVWASADANPKELTAALDRFAAEGRDRRYARARKNYRAKQKNQPGKTGPADIIPFPARNQ